MLRDDGEAALPTSHPRASEENFSGGDEVGRASGERGEKSRAGAFAAGFNETEAESEDALAGMLVGINLAALSWRGCEAVVHGGRGGKGGGRQPRYVQQSMSQVHCISAFCSHGYQLSLRCGDAVGVVLVSYIQRMGCLHEKKLLYTVVNPARGLLNLHVTGVHVTTDRNVLGISCTHIPVQKRLRSH